MPPVSKPASEAANYNMPIAWKLGRCILMCMAENSMVHYKWATGIVGRLAMGLLHDHQRVVTLGSLPCGAEYLSAIQLCAHFGLEHYLIDLLDGGYDVNSRDSDGDTAVTQAAISDIIPRIDKVAGGFTNFRIEGGAMTGHRHAMDSPTMSFCLVVLFYTSTDVANDNARVGKFGEVATG
ncbi:hypothetical protein BD779DRAFT_1790576 [Infundibulicybe gibba]|nr:hypothetical protein BD779DRAFT_1790576 [Infundibulicybe gibba]